MQQHFSFLVREISFDINKKILEPIMFRFSKQKFITRSGNFSGLTYCFSQLKIFSKRIYIISSVVVSERNRIFWVGVFTCCWRQISESWKDRREFGVGVRSSGSWVVNRTMTKTRVFYKTLLSWYHIWKSDNNTQLTNVGLKLTCFKHMWWTSSMLYKLRRLISWSLK